MNTIKIKEINLEVETEIHDKGKEINEIKIPKGWRLLASNEIFELYFSKYRKKLHLDNTWEFVAYKNKIMKKIMKKIIILRFYASSDRAGLYCYRYPEDSYPSLGVRFCRRIK